MASAAAQELAQLRDIHLPEPIGWWPLAPGWYLLLFLVICSIAVTAFYSWRWYNNSLSKRQALRLLDTYYTQYQNDHNSQLASARASEILKRVALVYFPREKVASLNGKAWIQFLNDTGKDIDFDPIRYEMLELPYSVLHPEKAKPQKIEILFQSAKNWIKQRSQPCSN